MTYKRSSMSPWKWWKCITIVLVTYSLLQSHPSHPWIIFLTFVSSIDYLQVLWLSIPTFVASVFIMQCLFDLPHLWWMMPISHWEILALWLVAFFFFFFLLFHWAVVCPVRSICSSVIHMGFFGYSSIYLARSEWQNGWKLHEWNWVPYQTVDCLGCLILSNSFLTSIWVG